MLRCGAPSGGVTGVTRGGMLWIEAILNVLNQLSKMFKLDLYNTVDMVSEMGSGRHAGTQHLLCGGSGYLETWRKLSELCNLREVPTRAHRTNKRNIIPSTILVTSEGWVDVFVHK